MEKYGEYILEILLNRNISCRYSRDEGFVYSFKNLVYGNMLGVYSCSNRILRNITIYNQFIIQSKRKYIRAYLEELNREISGGHFLTNPNIEYIVFYSKYDILNTCEKASYPSLVPFCLYPYELFTNYYRTFYNMINER